MIALILCLLLIFALVALIFGRDTAQRGIFLTLGITGAVVLSFVQAAFWIGLIALAFLLPPVGVPLLLVALFVRYVLPFWRALAKSRTKGAILNADHEARRKRIYFAERKVEHLHSALERGVDADAVSLCKEISQDEGWHLALPILADAFTSPKAETRLCAIHGIRHIYSPQVVQRIVAGDATFNASSRQHWHNYNYKPELLREVTEMLGKCALDVREEKRVRVAALIAIGNATYVEAYGTTLALLGDKDEDVCAAACRASRQLMHPATPIPNTQWHGDYAQTPQQWGLRTAAALYQSRFGDLLIALGSRNERLQMEAIGTACAMAQLADVAAANLDGLLRVMQGLSSAPSVSVKVHDAADKAIEMLKSIQRGHRAHGGVASA